MPVALATRPRVVFHRSPSPLGSLGVDFLVFLLPVLCAFTVNVGGELPYGEILLLLILPFILVKKHREIFRKDYRIIYILMGLWLFSQIITDIYVGAPGLKRIKGIARVVFFALDLMGTSGLIAGSRRRMSIFALGIAVFGLVAERGSVPTMNLATEWKMLFGISFSIVLLLVASRFYRKRNFPPVGAIVLVMALSNLYFGARSGVVVDIATFFLVMPMFRSSPRSSSTLLRSPVFRAAALFVLAMVAVWTSQAAIHWGVTHGIYSEREEAKFSAQSAGKLGILFGGRPEGPVAVQAIIDSPILGHGSYAVDPKYLILLQDYQYKWGYSESDEPIDDADSGIPTHSHLTMAWVEAGFLGSLLWFYLLILIGRALIRITETTYPLAPLAVFLFINFSWDILFSPFGETRRMFESFFIVLLIDVMRTPAVRSALRSVTPPLPKRIHRGVPNRPVLPRFPRPNTAR